MFANYRRRQSGDLSCNLKVPVQPDMGQRNDRGDALFLQFSDNPAQSYHFILEHHGGAG